MNETNEGGRVEALRRPVGQRLRARLMGGAGVCVGVVAFATLLVVSSPPPKPLDPTFVVEHSRSIGVAEQEAEAFLRTRETARELDSVLLLDLHRQAVARADEARLALAEAEARAVRRAERRWLSPSEALWTGLPFLLLLLGSGVLLGWGLGRARQVQVRIGPGGIQVDTQHIPLAALAGCVALPGRLELRLVGSERLRTRVVDEPQERLDRLADEINALALTPEERREDARARMEMLRVRQSMSERSQS